MHIKWEDLTCVWLNMAKVTLLRVALVNNGVVRGMMIKTKQAEGLQILSTWYAEGHT